MIIKKETIAIVKRELDYDKDHYYANIARYIIKAYTANESMKIMCFHLNRNFGIKKQLCANLIKEVMNV